MRRSTWMAAALLSAGLSAPAAAQDGPDGKAVEMKAKRGMADLEREAREMKAAGERKGGQKADKLRHAGGKAKAMEKKAAGRAKAADKAAVDKAKAAEKKAAGKAKGAENKAAGKAKAAKRKAERADKEAAARGGKGERADPKAQRDRARARMAAAGVDATRPAVVQQQRRHARRLARLQRIRALAEAKGRAKVVARVDQLEAKETARHTAWLGRFAAKKGGEE